MSDLNELHVPIRVRYSETDAMGYLHHGNYPAYFEQARTELFRVNGGDYRAMEQRGLFFVVVDMTIKFRQPARYDDVVTVIVTADTSSAAKLRHKYQVKRGETVLTDATTTLALVNREGQVQRLSDHLPGFGL